MAANISIVCMSAVTIFQTYPLIALTSLLLVKRPSIRMPRINKIGNIIAPKIPAFKLSEKALDTSPTKVGPPEQPRSPANARNANMAVPPPRIEAEAILKVPGHNMPTDNPHKPQPISPRTGYGESDIIK